jgi:hypothetical protein
MAYSRKELNDWFSDKVRSTAGHRKVILNTQDRERNLTVIGKLYFFAYDPKMKTTLPMYDRFPLVFPIEGYADGFLGLNLHYLFNNERAALLNKLIEFKTNGRNDESTKLKLSYDLLSSTKRIASAMRPCIKRYLFGHVRSKFVEVPANEWDKAIQLPVEQFVYKGKK